jgi:hypothetical protein
MKSQPNQVYTFGNDLVVGSYIAKVIQGNETVMVRLIKQ